jgi:hypothetical protein
MGAADLASIASPKSVKKATKADADLVIGAVSTNPGFIIGDPSATNPVLIGLAGRIPVKVTGHVTAGDFITVSDIPGVGERATKAGYVIGRAIEDVNNGLVMMIIQPTYFNPAVKADGTIVGGSDAKKVFVDESEAGKAVKGQLNQAAIQQAVQQEIQNTIETLPQATSATNLTVSGDVSANAVQTDVISPQTGKDVVIVIG